MNQPAYAGQRVLVNVTFAVVLGGCAVGGTHSYDAAPVSLSRVSSAAPVVVGVQDSRAYVISGNKPEKFVGLARGGYGNPFDVSTQSGGPLAIEMRDALVKALKAKGIAVSSIAISPSDAPAKVRQSLMGANARKLVLVTLREWKSDSLMSTSLLYDVTLSVLDEKGVQLATHQIKGTDNLGSLGFSSSAGVSSSFARKFETLFDDDRIVAALR